MLYIFFDDLKHLLFSLFYSLGHFFQLISGFQINFHLTILLVFNIGGSWKYTSYYDSSKIIILIHL